MATINPFQGPINYSVDVQSPFEAALGGFKIGAAGAEIQAQQQAQQKAKTYQTGIDAFFAKPAEQRTYSDLEPLLVGANKQQFDALQAVAKGMSEQKLDSSKRFYGQLLVSLEKNPETAKTILNQTIEAEKDPQQKLAWQDMLKTIDISPTKVAEQIELLGAATFGKDWHASITSVRSERRTAEGAPAELREKLAKASEAETKARVAFQTETDDIAKAKALRLFEEAKAKKEAVEAEFAKDKAVAEEKQRAATLRKTDADILIAKETNRIAALNAAAAKELNAVKRDEILQRREDAIEKRDQAKRDQDSLLGNQLSSIDNFLNTAIRATNTPLSVRKSATGPIASQVFTISQEVADFEGLIETLGAQAFLAQIPQIKGTGSLSENEGNKLQASLQNLSLKQSPERLQENINEAVRLLTKARENIATRSGKAVAPPDVPAGELNVTVGGTTYNFPTKAAADAFRNSDAYRRAAGNR
jgi:hypothetical protein